MKYSQPNYKEALLCPALLDYSLSWPGFKMHLFGSEARGMSLVGFRQLQLSNRRPPRAGRKDRRSEGKEAREREQGGERLVKAVAG